MQNHSIWTPVDELGSAGQSGDGHRILHDTDTKNVLLQPCDVFASVEKLFAPESFESLPLSVTAYFQFAKSFPQQRTTSMPLKHLDKERSVWLQSVEVGCLSVFFLTWGGHPEGGRGIWTGDGGVHLPAKSFSSSTFQKGGPPTAAQPSPFLLLGTSRPSH